MTKIELSDLIRVTCPSCKKLLLVPQRFAGQSGKCSHCQSCLTIPGSSPNTLHNARRIPVQRNLNGVLRRVATSIPRRYILAYVVSAFLAILILPAANRTAAQVEFTGSQLLLNGLSVVGMSLSFFAGFVGLEAMILLLQKEIKPASFALTAVSSILGVAFLLYASEYKDSETQWPDSIEPELRQALLDAYRRGDEIEVEWDNTDISFMCGNVLAIGDVFTVFAEVELDGVKKVLLDRESDFRGDGPNKIKDIPPREASAHFSADLREFDPNILERRHEIISVKYNLRFRYFTPAGSGSFRGARESCQGTTRICFLTREESVAYDAVKRRN